MSKIKQLIKPFFYWIFDLLSKLKTTFFSNFFIASGYFIKSNSEYNKSIAKAYKEDRFRFHEYLSTQFINPQEKIHYFEFGVRWGQIIGRWAGGNKNTQSLFAGFDTFTGIPEAWGSEKKGSYSNDGVVPQIDDSRVRFCVGLVQDTLPVYLKKVEPGSKLILHLDFDLYNATLFALICLQPLLKKGDVIIFDEYFSITKNHHEYRAFHDFLSLHKISYNPLFKCRSGQYAIELI
jgi:O-methyltransferase